MLPSEEPPRLLFGDMVGGALFPKTITLGPVAFGINAIIEPDPASDDAYSLCWNYPKAD